MAGSRGAALAVMCAIAVGVVGCGGGDDDKPAGTDIVIVTPGTRDDPDWTKQVTDGGQAAAKKLGIRAKVVDGSAGGALKRSLTTRAQLLVVPSEADRSAAVRLAVGSEVPTLVWGDPNALKAGLVGDVEADLRPGAYQAGAMAVQAARERSIGIVVCDDGSGGWDLSDRFEIAAAYLAGARSKDPKTKAGYVIAGSDAEGAKQATVELAKRKLQMIMPICGAPGNRGVVEGLEQVTKNVEMGEDQLVGLVGDKGEVNRENIVLTSVMINPAVAIEKALRDIRTDRFGTSVYRLTLANKGITLLQTGRTPADAYEAALKVEPPEQLPLAPEGEDVDKLIAE